MIRLVSALLLCAFAAGAQPFEFWPGAKYDPAIPSPEKVLGYPLGTKHATPDEMVRYLEALAAAAPSRIKVFEYGRTWEGRKLIYAAIGSEQNLRRLDEIKAAVQRISDPRKTSTAEAKQLSAAIPVVVGLSYGVHGNEISSPDAALMTAYHLIAAKGDAIADAAQANVLVLLDPMQNPDGRARFVHNYTISAGLLPDPDPAAAERDEPWPGGRSNHYLFDMNRDWFALTQPESRGRVKYVLEWKPQVFVDLHEMGSDSTYFFAPGAAPYSPLLTNQQKEQMDWFGRNNGKWFDKFGWPYFTREVFDEFYPGYGASYPWYYGGFGMTYENASVRGLLARRSDGTIMDFRESVKKQFVASISTCETAAQNKDRLLANFHDYNRTAVEDAAKDPVKEYILAARGDATTLDKLAHLLAEQQVELKRASAAFKSGGKDFPAGSILVPLNQPRRRFIHAVLSPQVSMEPEFLKEQERRRKKKLRDDIYDITAWSLPMMYNVDCVAAAESVQVPSVPVTGAYQPKGAVSGKAQVAYLAPWGTQAAGRFLAGALRENLVVRSTGKSFTQSGVKYPAGTLIVLVKQNPASVHETVAKLAAASGTQITATDSSWVEDGVDFGSNQVAVLKKPAVAMLWDAPTSSLSAGHTRFVLERQFGYPVTAIRASSLGYADLSRFHVLILPSGRYGAGLGGPALERVKAWVRNGGTLIGIDAAVAFLASPQAGLLALKAEAAAKEPPKETAGAKPAPPGAAAGTPGAAAPNEPVPGAIFTKPEDLEKAIVAEKEQPDDVAGVILRAKPDADAWICAGLPDTLHVLFSGRTIYAPIKRDKGVNAVVFAGPEEMLASGYLWEENKKQLAYKPFVVVQQEGRGNVIGFTADPNFRAFHDGLNVLFLNAVFRAPGGGRGFGGIQEEER
jgi:hypothetical protein